MTTRREPGITPIGPELSPLSDTLRSIEIDQFQRYTTVAALLGALHREARQARVLDLGSGPNTTLRSFLPGDRFSVVRSDVQDYALADSDFLRVECDQPIPARDREFDYVVALDVMEHVPADRRRSWLMEASRVSSHAVVVTAPNGHPEVERAEAIVDAAHRSQNHAPHPFLCEHSMHGLPREHEVCAWLATLGRPFAVYAIHPLHQWLASLMLMQRYLTVHGGDQACIALNRAQNGTVRFWPREMLCYRKIYVSVADGDHFLRLPAGALAEGNDSPAMASDPLDQLAIYAAGQMQAEWFERFGAQRLEGELRAALDETKAALARESQALEAARASARASAEQLHDDLAAIGAALGISDPADKPSILRALADLQSRLAKELEADSRRYLRLRPRRLDANERAIVDRFLPREHGAT